MSRRKHALIYATSLDVLDKQLNFYAMRVKEWYGWHMPELAKILNDNLGIHPSPDPTQKRGR